MEEEQPPLQQEADHMWPDFNSTILRLSAEESLGAEAIVNDYGGGGSGDAHPQAQCQMDSADSGGGTQEEVIHLDVGPVFQMVQQCNVIGSGSSCLADGAEGGGGIWHCGDSTWEANWTWGAEGGGDIWHCGDSTWEAEPEVPQRCKACGTQVPQRRATPYARNDGYNW